MGKNMFNQNKIEEKWLQIWEDNGLFQQTEHGLDSEVQDKMYLLFAFAYPSGSGLHVGHVESKTALDILARYYRMLGKQVFFPVGWDAFGLPAENYAIKTGVHPKVTTKDSIDTFRRQIKRIGISYDWANEIATNHPGYYKWTQWLFIQLYKQGLAYQKNGMVNWCPQDQTVLANEQVVEGRCERCDSQVVQKELKQWYFKISEYQDELISGLDQVDWPSATKAQQLNWIGKKSGVEIKYQVDGSDQEISCFTTRPDTNFGATFIVLAPEHEFAKQVAQTGSSWCRII
jgi:leucyl-tRNA synthetase